MAGPSNLNLQGECKLNYQLKSRLKQQGLYNGEKADQYKHENNIADINAGKQGDINLKATGSI